MLNPQTPHVITTEDITVYHIIDGEKIRQYHSRLDVPGCFQILTPEDLGIPIYALNVILSQDDKSGVSTTIVEYQGREPDTIEAKIRSNCGNIFYTDLWMNGEAIDRSREIVVIKE